MAEAETTVEFAVNLTCSNCVKATEKVLKATPGITDFNVDLVYETFINDVMLYIGCMISDHFIYQLNKEQFNQSPLGTITLFT